MITKTRDGEVILARSIENLTATAVQNKVAGGWDFTAIDSAGRIVATDTIPSYGAALKAFAIVGL